MLALCCNHTYMEISVQCRFSQGPQRTPKDFFLLQLGSVPCSKKQWKSTEDDHIWGFLTFTITAIFVSYLYIIFIRDWNSPPGTFKPHCTFTSHKLAYKIYDITFSVLRDFSYLLNCYIISPLTGINESVHAHSAKMVDMTEEQNELTHQISLNTIQIYRDDISCGNGKLKFPA